MFLNLGCLYFKNLSFVKWVNMGVICCCMECLSRLVNRKLKQAVVFFEVLLKLDNVGLNIKSYISIMHFNNRPVFTIRIWFYLLSDNLP